MENCQYRVFQRLENDRILQFNDSKTGLVLIQPFFLAPKQQANIGTRCPITKRFFVPFAREMYDQGYKTTMRMEIALLADCLSFLLSRNFLRTVSNDAITPPALSSTPICPLGAQPLKNSSVLEISSPFLFSTLRHSSITKGVRITLRS